jgi:hypothetical protein
MLLGEFMKNKGNELNYLEIITYNIFIIFLSNAVVSPFLWFLNIYKVYLNYTRKKITQTQIDKEIPRRTQRQLNELFENPNVDFAFKFSYITKTVLMTVFYLPLLPIGVIISLLGLIFAYLVEKNNMLKNYKRPDMPNEILAEYFLNYFKLVLFVYAVNIFLKLRLGTIYSSMKISKYITGQYYVS